MALVAQDGKYSGCNLVMRVLAGDDYTLDEQLSTEQKSMVSYLRKISGSNERDHIRKLLLDYHLAYLRQLYNLTYGTGGAQLSLTFMEHLRRIDREHQWNLRFHPESLLENDDYQLNVLREALPSLLDEAKRFVSKLTDLTTVEAEIQSVSSQFSDAVHKNIEFYN